MITQDRKSLLLATALAAQAGFVDALGFIHLGGFFISFMSGNSTRFAVGLAGSGFHFAVLLPFALIALFVIGVMLGAALGHIERRKKPAKILALVFALLSGAAIAHHFNLDALAVALMVMAMGAENDVFVSKGEVSVAVTYMTGTLVKLGQRLAGNLLGEEKKPWLPFLILWLGLILGAVLGSVAYAYIGLDALFLTAAFAGGVALFIQFDPYGPGPRRRKTDDVRGTAA